MKEKIEQIKQFLNEVKLEMKKVTWPPRKIAAASTSVVLVVVFIIAVFLGIIDYALAKLVSSIIN